MLLKGHTENQVLLLQRPSCFLWFSLKSGSGPRKLHKLSAYIFCCSQTTQLSLLTQTIIIKLVLVL